MRTPKYEFFIREYMVDMNATQAAIRAGYSKNSAEAWSCKLLVKYRQEVDKRLAERAERLKLTADEVIGNIRWAIDDARKTHDRTNLLRGSELLAKHLGMLRDAAPVSIYFSLADVVTKSIEKHKPVPAALLNKSDDAPAAHVTH